VLKINTRSTSICLLSFLLLAQTLVILPAYAFTISESSIAPSSFSPDGNGLNDTTTITVVLSNHVATLYVNIFNQSSAALVANHRIMTENPTKTYKYTWDGKDDSSNVVPQGIYTVRVSDNPSQYGDTIGTVDVNLTAPGSPSLTINGGATYTISRNVNLTISAIDASQMKISNSADFSGATWETYTTTKQWTLTTNDGSKTVYINFRNIAGTNISTSASITLDTILADPALSIKNGAGYTNSRDVNLTITANDATYMKIDNNTNFVNMTSWIPKSSTYRFRLPSGADGIRTVYLRVKDDAGNIKTTSDTITLDTTAPSDLTLSINNDAAYTNSTAVTLTVSASGGPFRMYFSNTGTNWTGYTYATSHSWQLTPGDGTKTVYYKTADEAGNNATPITATITLDTAAPSPVILLTPTNSETLTTQSPTFTWSNPNPSGTKNFYIDIIQSGSTIQSSSLNSSTTTYTASTLAQGTYSWKVTIYDMADNSATTSQYTFTISITGAVIPAPLLPANNAHVNNLMPKFQWTQTGDSYDLRYGYTENNLTLQRNGVTTVTLEDISFSNGTTIYWSVRSHSGVNTSDYSTVRSFTIDTTEPTNCSILINGGSNYTTSPMVTLTLHATEASMMMISNNASFSGASWETYATTKSWTLASSDGVKTVNFKAKDNAVSKEGLVDPNIASAVNDTIILDTAAPTITRLSPDATTTTTTNLAIRVNLSDSGTGVNTSSVTLTLDNTSIPYANLIVTSGLVRYTAPTIALGTHTVRVTAKDYVDHTGYLNFSFTVETEQQQGGNPPGGGEDIVPTISNVTRSPATVTTSDVVTISATVTSVNTLKSVDLFWNDGTLHSKPMTLQSGHLYKTTIGPFTAGTRITYYVVALDNKSLEKQSATYNFTIKDNIGPTITVVSPEEGATITNRTPKIEATYSDSSGINTSTVKLTFDGTDVTTYATITTTKITYTPATQLSYKEYTVNLEVSDQAGNKATKTWSFTVIAEEHNLTKTITNITAGETKTIDFTDSGTDLEGIKITAANDIETITIQCNITGEKPEGVAVPLNSVYLYLIINTNVETASISSAVISFKVEQKWLTDNKIDKTTVKLLRYNNGWKELTPTIVSEDAIYVHYEAATPGFSTFAITGVVQHAGGFPLLFFAIIVIILVIIAAIVLLYYRGYF